MPCSGNDNETCGGSDRLNVFLDNAVPPPVIVQSVNGTQGGLWTYQGCYTSVLSLSSPPRCHIELNYNFYRIVLNTLLVMRYLPEL